MQAWDCGAGPAGLVMLGLVLGIQRWDSELLGLELQGWDLGWGCRTGSAGLGLVMQGCSWGCRAGTWVGAEPLGLGLGL